MRPIVNGLEQAYGAQIEFQSYNIASETGAAWAETYELRGHPAFLLLDSQGQERWRAVGLISQETMEAELEAVAP